MNIPAHTTSLFDHVLLEVESGRIHEATFLLAGTLDGIVAAGGDAAEWREGLLQHPLATLLGDFAKGGDAVSENPLCRSGDGTDVLCASIADLGFSRALAARHDLAVDAMCKAWATGKSIWLADDASERLLDRMGWRNTDNIACSSDLLAVSDRVSYDLIVAIGTAPALGCAALEARLRALFFSTAAGGTVLMASFVPGHSGHGWQMICNGLPLHCQDELTLRRSAMTAGFEITHFRDASNSLVWAILRRPLDGGCDE
ncbi:hypothetical protein [Altererythrobacter aquiaggeris]|uniref:hypothetical protein n=1 Tax=Aestuarierythrobacter aquiaggeris TaxID=1898396 RepID=UPI003015CB12